MKTKEFNPGNSSTRQKIDDFNANGKTVVCAPRPIPGEETWQGDWCAGVFWASGDLDEFQLQWNELDATEILLTSNSKLLLLAQEKYEKRKAYVGSIRNPESKLGGLPEWEVYRARNGDRKAVQAVIYNACWLREED
jgi:hypothetical protein